MILIESAMDCSVSIFSMASTAQNGIGGARVFLAKSRTKRSSVNELFYSLTLYVEAFCISDL